MNVRIIDMNVNKGVDVAEGGFGEKVRVKRQEKSLTQAELAKKAGITQATISRVESGEMLQLGSDKLRSLAKALDVSVDFLVGKIDRMEFHDSLINDQIAKVIFRGYEKLSEERKRQVLEYVEFLVKQEKSKRG